MEALANNRTCQNYGNVNQDIIDIFAKKTIKSGIVLMGGGIGCGKSSTTETFLQYLEDNNIFDTESIVVLKPAELHEARESIIETVKDLIEDSTENRLLVVFDEIDSIDAVNAALALSEAKHRVLCLVRTPYRAGIASVLDSALGFVADHKKVSLAKRLIRHTNLLIEQPSHCSQVNYQPEYRYLEFSPATKGNLTAKLHEHGLDYIYKDIANKALSHQES